MLNPSMTFHSNAQELHDNFKVMSAFTLAKNTLPGRFCEVDTVGFQAKDRRTFYTLSADLLLDLWILV